MQETSNEYNGLTVSDDLETLGIVIPDDAIIDSDLERLDIDSNSNDRPDDAEKWLEEFYSKSNQAIIPVPVDPITILPFNNETEQEEIQESEHPDNEKYLIYRNDGEDVDLDTLGRSKLVCDLFGHKAEGFLECLYKYGVRITISLMKAIFEDPSNIIHESESGLTVGDEIFEWDGYYITRNEIQGYITIEK
jgi:hypothetical protein